MISGTNANLSSDDGTEDIKLKLQVAREKQKSATTLDETLRSEVSVMDLND